MLDYSTEMQKELISELKIDNLGLSFVSFCVAVVCFRLSAVVRANKHAGLSSVSAHGPGRTKTD